MPMLLEDLAEEMSASYRRVAERFDAEGRDLDEFVQREADLDERRHRAVESAREATEYAISQLPQGEAYWQGILTKLRKKPTEEQALRMLRAFLGLCEAVQITVAAVRNLWKFAERWGAIPERLDQLNKADAWFRERAEETKRAIEHRIRPWQPADPERFAAGLQRAREGKTVSADEARTWFRGAGE